MNRTQLIGNEPLSLIPPFTIEEVRELAGTDQGHEWRRTLNRDRMSIKNIEKLVNNQELRGDVGFMPCFHQHRDFPFQRFIELCLYYDQLERDAKESADKAHAMEIRARAKWEEATLHRNEQNRVLARMFRFRVHHDTANLPNRVEWIADEGQGRIFTMVGEGSAEDPFLIDLD